MTSKPRAKATPRALTLRTQAPRDRGKPRGAHRSTTPRKTIHGGRAHAVQAGNKIQLRSFTALFQACRTIPDQALGQIRPSAFGLQRPLQDKADGLIKREYHDRYNRDHFALW